MKFRYFLTLIASVLVFAGCMQESIDSFENIKLDKTYLTIPEAGGEVVLTITATQDWNFVETEMWPRVIAYQKDSDGKEIEDKDGNKVIDESKTVSSWLTLKGEMSGKAGVTKAVFSAEPTNGGREIELSIKAGNNVQYFRVRQGTMLASDATCAEVIAGVDGKSYRVQGVCTSIANDYYGNFYLNDGTGEIYIYGTKDADGQYNWDDFNIEVGDSVKVEGPRKDYNGTIELVDALFIKVIKSLIKLVEPTDKMVSEEGETFDVKLAYKGKGVFYTVADECSSWVKIEGMTSKSGVPTKLEPNPADTAIVTVTVAPYDEPSSRKGSIEFSSSLDDAKSVITFAFRQGVAEISVADFLEKEVGDTPYKLTGKIANLANTTYGNFDLVDATGSVYVYGLTATKVTSNDKSFSTLGLREGDIVTLIGTRGEYKEEAQVAGPAYYVSHIGSTDVTVEEFLAKEKSKDVWYRLTGKVTNLKPGEYGNFHLEDETGSVYVYGLTKAPVAKNDKTFLSLGVKEGDTVTLVGTRDRYDSSKVPEETEQVGGPAYYISHVAGEGGEEPEPAEPTVATVAQFKEAAEDATVYQLSGTVAEITSAYSAEYGNISFDLEDETGTVNIFRMSCEGIEDPTAISVGDEITVQGTRSSYEGEIQMAKGGKCIKFTDKDGGEAPAEPEFEAGKYWIVESGFVGTPELKSGTYGYMLAEEAWKSSTGISSTEANAFTFEAVEGGYTIKDSKGRYLYSGKKSDGTYYNTFNASADASENHVWTVVKNTDGTYKITNNASTFDVHYGASYQTFECVANVTDFPELVKVENAVPAVTLESSLTFEAEGGSQTITLPEGVTATPSCDNAAFTATASANVVTVTAAAATEAQAGVLTLALTYNGFSITKTVDLSQKAPAAAGEKTVTFDVASYNFSNQQALDTYVVEDITFAFAGGGNNNNPKYYTSGSAVRCYPKNTITISGGTIKKVTVVAPSGYDNAIDLYDGTTKLDGFVWSGSSENLVLTFDMNKTSGQSRFVKIEVTYEQ